MPSCYPSSINAAGIEFRDEDPITTCIAVEMDAPVESRASLSATERKARDFLADLIAAEGAPLPPGSGLPDGLEPGWVDAYPLQYNWHSWHNWREREDRAARRGSRGKPTQPGGSDLAQLSRDRAAAKAFLVERRLVQGFAWHGGFAGGSRDYPVKPMVFRGLVSDRHPILRLFVAKTRRARHLLSGDDKQVMTCTDSKLLALDSAYVESSKEMLGVLRVEVDIVWPSWAALEEAIRACGVPVPNVAVGYEGGDGRVWRPHLMWLLGESVCASEKASQRHQAAFRNALRGLTVKLLPIGADAGGVSNAHRHKNPLSPLWARMVMADEPYAIDTDTRADGPAYAPLRPHLPAPQESIAALRQATEARRASDLAAPAPDHADPATAAGSNAVFRHLCDFARRRVVAVRDRGEGTRESFGADVLGESLGLSPDDRASRKAARSGAFTVAEWTWCKYRTPRREKPFLPKADRRDKLSAGAMAAAAAKRNGTLGIIVAAIASLSHGDTRPTQAAVARATGKALATVKRHWRDALREVPKVSLACAIDKKPGADPEGTFDWLSSSPGPALAATDASAPSATSPRQPSTEGPSAMNTHPITSVPSEAEDAPAGLLVSLPHHANCVTHATRPTICAAEDAPRAPHMVEVVGIADLTHGRPHGGLLAALAESQRLVLLPWSL